MARRSHRRRRSGGLSLRQRDALAKWGIGAGLVAVAVVYLASVLGSDLLLLGAIAAGAVGIARYGPGRAGGFARRRGDALVAKSGFVGLVATGLVYLAVGVVHGALLWLLLIVAAMAGASAYEMFESGGRWRRGAGSERRVAWALRPLKKRGWRIEHDVMKPRGGNVDHVAFSPDGDVFTIETKSWGFGEAELDQARSHARWASRHYGRPAIAVLCVANRPQRPKLRAGVWCVGAGSVEEFLAQQQQGQDSSAWPAA